MLPLMLLLPLVSTRRFEAEAVARCRSSKSDMSPSKSRARFLDDADAPMLVLVADPPAVVCVPPSNAMLSSCGRVVFILMLKLAGDLMCDWNVPKLSNP